MRYNIDKKHNIVRAIFTIENVMLGKKWYDKKTYIGMAKCCPSDKFDEEKGKTIAKKRALYKYYTELSKQLHEFNKSLQKRVNENEQRIVNCEFKLLNLSAEIEELCI